MSLALVPNPHGGDDGGVPPRFDFSSNANPLPAPGWLSDALQQADRRHYPDPAYAALRTQLAAQASGGALRITVSAGSSEAIRRLTLAALLHGVRQVWVPQPGYGDYAAAAQALGLAVSGYADGEALLSALAQGTTPALLWLCEPNNPDGSTLPPPFWQALRPHAAQHLIALDRAYEPLRLVGHDPVPAALTELAFSLMSPNKALGHTGVRAGWVGLPREGVSALHDAVGQRLAALAPSWVLSAEGVALLQAWTQPACAAHLQHSRAQLRQLVQRQRALLSGLGWQQRESVTPFWLARPPRPLHATLRAHGLRLRDASSFGLPGWLRLSAQLPAAQDALHAAAMSLNTPESIA